MGELPDEWKSKYESMIQPIKRNGAFVESGRNSGSKLDRMFDEHVHEPELKVLLPVIRGLTKLLPADRISATDALDLILANGR